MNPDANLDPRNYDLIVIFCVSEVDIVHTAFQ